MLLIPYLNNFLMRAKVKELLLDIFWLHLSLWSTTSTVNIRYIQPVLSSYIIIVGVTKHKNEINTAMNIIKDVGKSLKL